MGEEGWSGRNHWFCAMYVAAALGVLFGFSASASGAEQALITQDGSKPKLTALESGGWSATIGLHNLQTAPVTLSVASVSPATGAVCTAQFETGATVALGAAHDEDVTITYASGCKIGKGGATVKLVPGGTPSKALSVVLAAPNDTPTPAWSALLAFPIALGVVLVLLLGMLFMNDHMTVGTKLPHLPTTWSFKESWASNVTSGVAIVSGVFGSSDVLKAFLGEQGEASMALTTVGAAVALALVGLGALVIQAAKYVDCEAPTAGGFVLGAACTLGGAFGELYVLWEGGSPLELGGLQHVVLPVALVVVAAVLARYAYVTVRATLETGSDDSPAPVTLSETTTTAVLIAHCFRTFDEEAMFNAIKQHLTPKVEGSRDADKRFLQKRAGGPVKVPPKRMGAALL